MKKNLSHQRQIQHKKDQTSAHSLWHERHGGHPLPVSLGHLEYLLISTAVRLGETAYGAAIRREIKKSMGLLCSTSAISSAIANLEEKGLVKSWMSEPTGERGGRSRRMIRIT